LLLFASKVNSIVEVGESRDPQKETDGLLQRTLLANLKEKIKVLLRTKGG